MGFSCGVWCRSELGVFGGVGVVHHVKNGRSMYNFIGVSQAVCRIRDIDTYCSSR